MTSAEPNPAPESIVATLRPIVVDGLGAFTRTLLGMVALAVALTVAAYLVAPGWAGVLAAVGSLIVSALAAPLLAVKRAVLTVVRAAIVKARLGERAVTLLFTKLTLLTGIAERLPLAQAEALVRKAVASLLEERSHQTGFRAWLARLAQKRVLELVERVTLAEFRAADQTTGGVDLGIVRAHLLTTVQDTLLARVDAALKSVTMAAVIMLSAVCLGGAYALRGIDTWQ